MAKAIKIRQPNTDALECSHFLSWKICARLWLLSAITSPNS